MLGRKIMTDDRREVRILSPGVLNNNAGPDFSNAKIMIDDTEWAGNVEIHVKASDWFRHHHDTDPAYDNIILHVVAVADVQVFRKDGSKVPQAEVTLPEGFFKTYSELHCGLLNVRCAARLKELPRLTVSDWLSTLSIERLQAKASRILSTNDLLLGDWEQTCFVTLARGLGFGLNSEPFEMLAKSIPLNFLSRHSDNPLQLQALLFGQAGMLDMSAHIFDEFYQQLCREYYFLARKYGLRPISSGVWKYARTRPANFPHRRIAILANAAEGGFRLFRKIMEADGDADSLRNLFDWQTEGYWMSRYSFDADATAAPGAMSRTSRDLLLVNVCAPLYYAYGASTGNPALPEYAFRLLESLPAERNGIVSQWTACGIKADNAARSQALIHLRKEYCDNDRCLHCRFGHHLLRKAATQNHTATP